MWHFRQEDELRHFLYERKYRKGDHWVYVYPDEAGAGQGGSPSQEKPGAQIRNSKSQTDVSNTHASSGSKQMQAMSKQKSDDINEATKNGMPRPNGVDTGDLFTVLEKNYDKFTSSDKIAYLSYIKTISSDMESIQKLAQQSGYAISWDVDPGNREPIAKVTPLPNADASKVNDVKRRAADILDTLDYCYKIIKRYKTAAVDPTKKAHAQ